MRSNATSGISVLAGRAGLCLIASLLGTSLIVNAAAPLNTSFTYQGRLQLTGQPVDGPVNATFTLYDDPSAGASIGTQIVNGLSVTNGLFSVTLNDAAQFGPNPFTGNALWLQITINGQPLAPRQPLTIAPYAGFALQASQASAVPWSGLTGVPAGFADGVDEAGPWTLSGQNVFLDKNVGIGTSTPESRLHIASVGSAESRLRMDSGGLNRWSFLVDPGSASTFALRVRDDYLNFERFVIDDKGEVGIGISSPQTRLHVATTDAEIARFEGSSTIGTWFNLRNTTAGNRYWRMIATGTGNGEGAGKLMISTGQEPVLSTPTMVFDPNGNVGIGTSTPGQRLTVVGNICATGSIGSCSDERFKKNVKPLERALDVVEKLRPVAFDWRRDEFPQQKFSSDRQVGLIAQEVQKVAPELVQKGSDGYLSVDYARLTPVLIEAVKEQQEEITRKDRQISEIRTELDELKAMVKKLAAANDLAPVSPAQ